MLITRRLFALLSMLLLLTPTLSATECSDSTPEFAAMKAVSISISIPGDELKLLSRLADSNRLRMAGYQHICPEAVARSSILFVFPQSVVGQFHMRNVHADLDLLLFDRRGYLVEHHRMIAEAGTSGQGQLYGDGAPFRYALELPGGTWDRLAGDVNWARISEIDMGDGPTL